MTGSDSINQFFFAYNGDLDDKGALGFGINPPAIGGAILNQSMAGFMYYNNSPSATTGIPNNSFEYANYLNQKWSAGSLLRLENPSDPGSIMNGDGFEASPVFPATKWAFNDQANWYQDPSSQSDVRALPSAFVGDLLTGEEVCIDLVLTVARDSINANNDLMASVSLLKMYLNSVMPFYNNSGWQCLGATMAINEPL